MNVIRTLVVVAACALSACASTDKEVRVQSSPAGHVAAHAKTYAIGSSEQAPARYKLTPRGEEVARHVRPMLEEALRAKGYVPAATVADADLVWRFGVGRREVEKPPTPSNRDTGDSYSDPNEHFDEGALALDALDKNGAVAWHGQGRTEIDHDAKTIDDALLRKTVDQIMARFPNAEK